MSLCHFGKRKEKILLGISNIKELWQCCRCLIIGHVFTVRGQFWSLTGVKRASFLHTLSRKVHMQFKRHPRVVLLSACTQVPRQNKGEKAPIKQALCSSQVGVKDWNKTFIQARRNACTSGKYLMAGGEMLSKQSREQWVGNTTAGRRERQKQSTNRLPTSKYRRFVSSKEAFAGPGGFSELQHLLCSALNIPKASSAGVLSAAKTLLVHPTAADGNHLLCAFFRSGSHLEEKQVFPRFWNEVGRREKKPLVLKKSFKVDVKKTNVGKKVFFNLIHLLLPHCNKLFCQQCVCTATYSRGPCCSFNPVTRLRHAVNPPIQRASNF